MMLNCQAVWVRLSISYKSFLTLLREKDQDIYMLWVNYHHHNLILIMELQREQEYNLYYISMFYHYCFSHFNFILKEPQKTFM